ncbi:hypothetical protein [uncultured Mucilaginibacter sp.]|uniref:hypothetical protein n=1 Tax=uncultured Mucilaginibacter sp. TaxID=797541 RepID=UPI002616091A|nr:hypothetical protein [uncultured Mucilaginibacter sp.]
MDKELALIIAEMLIKQDETNAQVKNVGERVDNVALELKETNIILKDFMAISVKQWEQQHRFNETIVGELKSIKEVLSTFSQLENRLKAVEERENKFESRLANLEKLLKAS